MSLTSRSRLTSDSHRSPSGAATATPRASRSTAEKSASLNGAISIDATTVTRTAPMTPPMRPSTVLFGLAADSGRVPGVSADGEPTDVVADGAEDGDQQDADAGIADAVGGGGQHEHRAAKEPSRPIQQDAEEGGRQPDHGRSSPPRAGEVPEQAEHDGEEQGDRCRDLALVVDGEGRAAVAATPRRIAGW